ncbi:DUF3293 domain-containing protein [Vibrio sinaloensis]|uniref:DUF3293 domain-containing protein n=1 Tax=Photobacterium sp. (strain ATCC 43367) TaxID=379097 RepID=UPI0022AFA858|nr:DUF3293 domain-containing protein [Vibrio sinaloensis]MCZ4294295.1 DUF3293 domain-containing protein [Vibrio sinaloensis]
MIIDAKLWQAYCDPYFRFEGKIKYENFAIITAWNPKSVWLSPDENYRNNQYLAAEIGHTCCMSVNVGNEDFSWCEESFAAAVSQYRAIELGRKYGQNAIYFVQRDKLYLISCLEQKQTTVLLGDWRSRCR